jgi:glutathione S-transferase
MAEIVLHGFALSTYVRTARLALHEKGVAYRLDPVELGNPALAQLHPFARIPSLDDGDFHLYETEAICRYVDEAFPGPSLQPRDVKARARMTQWIGVVNGYCYRSMIGDLVMERLVAPQMMGRAADEAKIAGALPAITHQLSVLEQGIGDGPYLAGAEPSLADLFLVPLVFYVSLTPEGQRLLPAAPRIVAWHERMATRASYAATKPF